MKVSATDSKKVLKDDGGGDGGETFVTTDITHINTCTNRHDA